MKIEINNKNLLIVSLTVILICLSIFAYSFDKNKPYLPIARIATDEVGTGDVFKYITTGTDEMIYPRLWFGFNQFNNNTLGITFKISNTTVANASSSVIYKTLDMYSYSYNPSTNVLSNVDTDNFGIRIGNMLMTKGNIYRRESVGSAWEDYPSPAEIKLAILSGVVIRVKGALVPNVIYIKVGTVWTYSVNETAVANAVCQYWGLNSSINASWSPLTNIKEPYAVYVPSKGQPDANKAWVAVKGSTLLAKGATKFMKDVYCI